MTKLEPKWKCHECGEIHDDDDSANDCCRPEVSDGYVCPVCADWHREEDNALECCGYDEDDPTPPPSKLELEAAGQLRLIP